MSSVRNRFVALGDHTGWLSELLEDKLLIAKSLQDLGAIVN